MWLGRDRQVSGVVKGKTDHLFGYESDLFFFYDLVCFGTVFGAGKIGLTFFLPDEGIRRCGNLLDEGTFRYLTKSLYTHTHISPPTLFHSVLLS